MVNFCLAYSHYIFAYKHLNDKVASGGGLSRVPKLGPKAPVIWSRVPVTALSQGNFKERLQCENVVPVGRVKVVPHDYS